MSLPTKALPADLRQMVEGRLIADGREPQNVQVKIREQSDGSVLLELQDMSGVFVMAQPLEAEETPEHATGGMLDLGEIDDIGELRVALQVANEERVALKEQVADGKKRLDEMWRENCLQLSNWDHDTQSKEEEIALLKVKVSELEKRLWDVLGGSTTKTTTAVPATSTALPSTTTLYTSLYHLYDTHARMHSLM